MKKLRWFKGLVLLDENGTMICSSDILGFSQKALIEEADTRGLKTLSREVQRINQWNRNAQKPRLKGWWRPVEHEKLMKINNMEPSIEYLEAKTASHKYVMVSEDANNKL